MDCEIFFIFNSIDSQVKMIKKFASTIEECIMNQRNQNKKIMTFQENKQTIQNQNDSLNEKENQNDSLNEKENQNDSLNEKENQNDSLNEKESKFQFDFNKINSVKFNESFSVKNEYKDENLIKKQRQDKNQKEWKIKSFLDTIRNLNFDPINIPQVSQNKNRKTYQLQQTVEGKNRLRRLSSKLIEYEEVNKNIIKYVLPYFMKDKTYIDNLIDRLKID